jgi:signal transduction histidine kinase
MARRALQGVEEVSRAAEDIANGAFNRRVSVRDRSEEIERLVATFNVMVDRIAAVISQMRTMTDNIAHDLRSPLGRIRAIAERALSASRSVDEHRTASADTLEECDRLLQMINTTLDVAEAEVGAAQLLKEEIDLASIIQDACELFEPIAEDKEIEISAKLEANCQVRGNIQYVQRMLANLLDNALKYTPPKGSVSVELARDDQVAAISVSDTGVGIAPDEQARIFERFYRGDQSRSQQGFGLGLSFARAVAHALGGDISVTSTPNKGSRFTVTLPAAAPAI